jgi:hypothetical protein
METGNMIILMMTLRLFKDLLRFVVWCIIKVNKKQTHNTQIHDRSLPWLGTGTSIITWRC